MIFFLFFLALFIETSSALLADYLLEYRYHDDMKLFTDSVMRAAQTPSSCLPNNTVVFVTAAKNHVSLIDLQLRNVMGMECFVKRYVFVATGRKTYDSVCNNTALGVCILDRVMPYRNWSDVPHWRKPENATDELRYMIYGSMIWKKYDYLLPILRAGVNVYMFDGDVVFLKVPRFNLVDDIDLSFQQERRNPKNLNDGQIAFKANAKTVGVVERLLQHHYAEKPKDTSLTQMLLFMYSNNTELKTGTPFETIRTNKEDIEVFSTHCYYGGKLFNPKYVPPSSDTFVATVNTYHCNCLFTKDDKYKCMSLMLQRWMKYT